LSQKLNNKQTSSELDEIWFVSTYSTNMTQLEKIGKIYFSNVYELLAKNNI